MPFSWDIFNKLPIVGILRGFDADLTVEIAVAAMERGLTTLEVTMNTAGAAEQIAALLEATKGEMNIGAGTVRSLEELDQALQAGAMFIVTPTVLPEVIERCVKQDIPVFPGAFTPTEIHRAWTAGASMVKLFPAGQFGPSYIKIVKAPLDDVKILATGGVRLSNVKEYIDAGADAFGLGTPLFRRERMEDRDWAWLGGQIQGFRKALSDK